jgi:hypothetical protein
MPITADVYKKIVDAKVFIDEHFDSPIAAGDPVLFYFGDNGWQKAIIEKGRLRLRSSFRA